MPSRARVLIVDDDPDIVACLVAWLEDRFEVLTAADGLDALRVLAEQQVDAIVLDLMMPNMNGVAFKQALDRRALRVPVILASAALDVAGPARALGAHGFLTKPLDLDALTRMLDDATGSGTPESGPPSGGGGTPGGPSRGTPERGAAGALSWTSAAPA